MVAETLTPYWPSLSGCSRRFRSAMLTYRPPPPPPPAASHIPPRSAESTMQPLMGPVRSTLQTDLGNDLDWNWLPDNCPRCSDAAAKCRVADGEKSTS